MADVPNSTLAPDLSNLSIRSLATMYEMAKRVVDLGTEFHNQPRMSEAVDDILEATFGSPACALMDAVGAEMERRAPHRFERHEWLSVLIQWRVFAREEDQLTADISAAIEQAAARRVEVAEVRT